jgi:glycine/D-amino acid oxidase-like deaminating enzyme
MAATQGHPHLIIGAGIAGCALAFAFEQAGKPFLVLNDEVGDAASAVAAGLFNPITGSRFVKTWMAEEVFEHLHPFYQQWEALLGTTFYHPTPIVRPFGSIAEQNTAIAKTAEPDYATYIIATDLPNELQNLVEAPLGGMVFGQGGWVDVPTLMTSMHNWLWQAGRYQLGSISPSDLSEANGLVYWKEQPYQSATFCTGYRASQEPAFDHIRFSPVRGEIIEVQYDSVAEQWPNLAVSKGIYLLGTPGTNRLRVGATYNWRQPIPETSPEGLAELCSELDQVLKTTYQVLRHQAGVRPAIADRRPVVGLLPGCNRIGILNGLGSKGTSLAPWLANHLVDFYIHNKALPMTVSPDRFRKKQNPKQTI